MDTDNVCVFCDRRVLCEKGKHVVDSVDADALTDAFFVASVYDCSPYADVVDNIKKSVRDSFHFEVGDDGCVKIEYVDKGGSGGKGGSDDDGGGNRGDVEMS